MQIQLEWKDFLKAVLLTKRPSLGLLITTNILILILAIGYTIFAISFSIPVLLWPVVLVIGFLIINWFFWFPNRMRKEFETRKMLHEPKTLEIKEEGLLHTSEKATQLIPWGEPIGWREDKELFVIYASDVMFNIYPKRFFSDNGFLNEVKKKLEENGVGEYKKQANRSYGINIFLLALMLMIPICHITILAILSVLENL